MKKVLCVSLMAVCSFAFGRSSSYYTIVVSPTESYIQKKQAELTAVDGEDGSVQWKRRHKRRRKTRRPQRGR